MDWEPIHKQPADFADANLKNHDSYIADFSWERACALLDGMPGGALNIAYQAIHRHVIARHGSKLALRGLGRDNETRDFSCADLAAAAIAALGTLKNGSVFSPLFSTFGSEPIRARATRETYFGTLTEARPTTC